VKWLPLVQNNQPVFRAILEKDTGTRSIRINGRFVLHDLKLFNYFAGEWLGFVLDRALTDLMAVLIKGDATPKLN
jgi:hypothetical protein